MRKPILKFVLITFTIVGVLGCKKDDDNITPEDNSINNNIVIHLPMNGDVTNKAEDSLTATVFGATLTTGIDGQANTAYSFDGNDYIEFSDDSLFDITDGFATSMFFKIEGQNTNTDAILFNYEGRIELSANEDQVLRYAISNTDPGWAWTNTDTIPSKNEWHHIVFQYDSEDKIKIYLNGDLVHSKDGDGDIGDSSTSQNSFRIGGREFRPQDGFIGKIDEFRLYTRALTENEIRILSETY